MQRIIEKQKDGRCIIVERQTDEEIVKSHIC